METNSELNEMVLKAIKLRVLQLETDNIIRKDPSSEMDRKVRDIITSEVK